MNCRRLTTLTALSVLAVSAAAHAQTPAYQYRTIAIHNVTPAAVLEAARWDSKDNAPLPAGVKKVFALQSNHVLVVDATPAGYGRIQAIVSAIDVPAPKPH